MGVLDWPVGLALVSNRRPTMATYNSWPNRETWLAACWRFTRGYGELMHESRELWRSVRGPSQNLRTRRDVAKRTRSMVAAAGDAIEVSVGEPSSMAIRKKGIRGEATGTPYCATEDFPLNKRRQTTFSNWLRPKAALG